MKFIPNFFFREETKGLGNKGISQLFRRDDIFSGPFAAAFARVVLGARKRGGKLSKGHKKFTKSILPGSTGCKVIVSFDFIILVDPGGTLWWMDEQRRPVITAVR